MKKTFLMFLVALLFFQGACSPKNAFESKKLDLSAEVKLEQGTVIVTGQTNLPDGFVLFIRVDAAPKYLSTANWSGQAIVVAGRFQFDSIFTATLPYSAYILISPAINPKWESQFSDSQVPFVIDERWEVDKSDSGSTQISLQINAELGTASDHRQILGPAVKELRATLGTLDHEMTSLEKLMVDPKEGYARFGRLHAKKRRTLRLNNGTTDFYYSDVFEFLRQLERHVEDTFLYALASFEKDVKEKEKHKNAANKFHALRKKTEQKLAEIEAVLNPDG